MEIKQLDKELINRANSNSFYDRGNHVQQSYKSYIDEVMNWEISDAKKQKILNEVHKKYSEILKYEALHVPVMVAGPAKYNSKKLDKSNQIMKAYKEFGNWFDDLRTQVKNLQIDTDNSKIDFIISDIESYLERNWDIRKLLEKLAYFDNKKFIELYEKYYDTYKWKKNTNIYKTYQLSLKGEIQEIKKETIFEDENFTAFIENDRAFIKFIMKCKPQLIYTLKKKGWWWNSYQKAWSTYLKNVDKEWISNISEKYSDYL